MKTQHKLIGIALGLFITLLGTASPAQAQVAQFDGRPAFAEGVETGYYVWHDGDKWSVRWTTTGKLRHFTGHVAAEGGEVKSLKRIDVESESKVLYPGRAPRVAVGPRGRVYRRGGRAPVVTTREQDKIEKDGNNRIVFNARTNDDLDGFDFKVDKKVTSLRFVLEIDNNFRPQLVATGKSNAPPPTVPFTLKLTPSEAKK